MRHRDRSRRKVTSIAACLEFPRLPPPRLNFVDTIATHRLRAVSSSDPRLCAVSHSVLSSHFFPRKVAAMSATEELSGILSRRQEINTKLEEGQEIKPIYKFINVYTEFHEFSRKEIKQYEATFNKFDEGRDGFLDLTEVKRMMERLGAPQTHLGLKAMIAEVDEDNDNKISFREFLLIYRKARAGELESDSGLDALARLTEINVDQVGVNGAKNFFEAKIEELSKSNKFHDEIIQEQEAKRQEAEEKALRRQQFKEKAALFQH